MAGKIDTHVKIVSVVLIMDNSPRTMWKLSVIEDVITGLDGLVRAAKICTPSGLLNCLTLVLLEI